MVPAAQVFTIPPPTARVRMLHSCCANLIHVVLTGISVRSVHSKNFGRCARPWPHHRLELLSLVRLRPACPFPTPPAALLAASPLLWSFHYVCCAAGASHVLNFEVRERDAAALKMIVRDRAGCSKKPSRKSLKLRDLAPIRKISRLRRGASGRRGHDEKLFSSNGHVFVDTYWDSESDVYI